MQTLFPDLRPPPDPPAEMRAEGPFAGVALEQSVDRELDYGIPPRLLPTLRVGQRVRVPLGRNNRPTHGYVVSIHDTSAYPKIKRLFDIDDERVLVPPKLMELGRWMSRYYCCPLGTVLESIIPSAVKKRIGVGYQQMVRLAQDRELAQTMLEKTKAPGARRRRPPAATRTRRRDRTQRLAGEAGTTPATVRKLIRLGLITVTPEVDLPRPPIDPEPDRLPEPDHPLNEHQQKVFDELLPRMTGGGFSVNLLLGVTGSGKTEVYLRCIREVVQRQAARSCSCRRSRSRRRRSGGSRPASRAWRSCTAG